MLLSSEGGPSHLLAQAFTVYAVFWIAVFVILFFGVGALLSRHDRILEKRRKEGSGGGH